MNIITIYPTACTSFNTVEYEFCLPNKVNCSDYFPEGILALCGQEHNCLPECLNIPYFIPAIEPFYIQTRFKTSSDPVVQILDTNKNVINVNAVVSSNIQKGVQTYQIDPALINTECFQVKITSGEIEVCSQFFKKPNCDDQFVSFEGVYRKNDCIGQSYDNTGFYNKIFLKGNLKYYTSTVEENVTNDIYRFYPSELLAPFMMKYLVNVILGAKKIMVNGQEYEYQGTGNVTPRRSGMYAPILEFSKSCSTGKNINCEN